jgi:hypothetical protein
MSEQYQEGVYDALACLDRIHASDRGYVARIARLLAKINRLIIDAMTTKELDDDEAAYQIAAAAEELHWYARALRLANQTAKNVQRDEGQISGERPAETAPVS